MHYGQYYCGLAFVIIIVVVDVKVAFAMFDKDGDGVITCREVLQVMVSLGIDVDSSEVKEIVRKIDLDGMT